MRDLVAGPRRFVELQRTLPGISTEQLRSRLNRMVADGLLTRQRYREVPPRVDYELTERARGLVPVLSELARWGYTWAWSAPRAGEAIDVGAILRLAPGLSHPPKSVRGTLELTVVERSKDGETRSYELAAHDGAVTLTEGPSAAPSARVRGDERAWVQALGPTADDSRLQIEGDKPLAGALLSALAPAVAARAIVAA